MSFFLKKNSKKPTRLFFATDLHASERTFRKFINAGKFYDADVLVMGGDITGKLLIPVIREKNGCYRATVQGRVEQLAGEEELKGLMSRLDVLGFYYQVMDEEEFQSTSADPAAVTHLSNDLGRQRLSRWRSEEHT